MSAAWCRPIAGSSRACQACARCSRARPRPSVGGPVAAGSRRRPVQCQALGASVRRGGAQAVVTARQGGRCRPSGWCVRREASAGTGGRAISSAGSSMACPTRSGPDGSIWVSPLAGEDRSSNAVSAVVVSSAAFQRPCAIACCEDGAARAFAGSANMLQPKMAKAMNRRTTWVHMVQRFYCRPAGKPRPSRPRVTGVAVVWAGGRQALGAPRVDGRSDATAAKAG